MADPNNQVVVPQQEATSQQADQSVQQPVQQPVVQAENLPQETKDRTREQFEKLLESNKRLYDANELLRKEIEQRRQSNQVFEPIQQVQQSYQNPQVDPKDFVEVDPVSGESYINEQRLRSKLDEVNQKASRAEQAVSSYIRTMEEREIERQNAEAFGAYPELNPGSNFEPNDKFSKTFHQQVRGVLFDSMYNADEYGGRPLTFKEAADFVKAQLPNNNSQKKAESEAEDAKAAEAARTLKEQSSAQASSQPVAQRYSPDEEEEIKNLRLKTRLGDPEALARRLLNTDHTARKEDVS